MKHIETSSLQKSADILLTAKQIAARTGIAVSTIYQWANERRFPTVKLGRALRIRESEVEKYVRRHERPALRTPVCASPMGGAL